MSGRLLRVAVLLGTLAVAVSPAEGQETSASASAVKPYTRFEFAILGGYRFESSLTFGGPSRYSSVDIDNAPTFGLIFGYYINPILEVEFAYSYADPGALAIATDPRDPNRAFDIGIHDIQVGWVLNFRSPRDRVWAYFGFGLGVTILNAREGIADSTQPSFSVSLGVKAYLSDKVGLRAEVRYIPAYLYTTGSGVDLCFDNSCWNTGDRYLQQLDLRAGATFRF